MGGGGASLRFAESCFHEPAILAGFEVTLTQDWATVCPHFFSLNLTPAGVAYP
ncbi:hypothetical protein BH11VER1_BH11VER1_39500 [soil metagenome]